MPEQKQTLTIQQALDLAVQHHNAGSLSQAETIYQQILQNDPNQPVALHLLGVIAHQVDKHDKAVDLITKALSLKPDYAEAHSNLGLALHELGRLEETVVNYRKALSINPDYIEAHRNLGLALREFGKPEEAVTSYRKALDLKPNYAEVHNNLGNALRDLGKLEEAVASYQKAMAIKPDYATAQYNLGNALQDLGRLEEAVASYQKALILTPDYAEAHSNLGNALKELGKPEEAVASYQKALGIKPDFAAAHNNLGLALHRLGKLEEAVASYHKALNLEPDLAEGWNNLQLAARALQFSEAQKGRKENPYEIGLSDTARATADFVMFEYYLDKFKPHKSEERVRKAMAALQLQNNEELTISGRNNVSGTPPPVADKLVALLCFGRSGTGLLHGLIDGHPEVSTLPSIYLRGFFNAGVWRKLSADSWRGLPERFTDEFAVLFDANSPKSTPGRVGENSSFLGQKEGMTTVGEKRDESLSLDRDQFCAEALRLMARFQKIDPKLFLFIVHAAFEKVLGTKTNKHTVFYHLHNPDEFAKLNFLRYAPNAHLLMMVREPVQCCESWIRNPFRDNDYNTLALRIVAMLFGIDQIAFRMLDSVGVRLEDLKMKPEATLHSICTWLGIKEAPSLHQTTAQGKKWWGDPTSPDYDENKAMSPFDKTSIKRPVGTIFSEKDQLVLRTLFYPFSVRFGYREPDPVAFEKDLKKVRPLFDELLDFEKVMSEKSKISPAQFKRSGDYLLLRASFMDRWNVLSEFKDYPHLLSPLEITRN